MVNERTATVLKALVEEYIDTASPVASESIAMHAPVRLSSATVRNKMAELEEEGYIRRPHISSGGVPSDKGYRFYVESLDEDLEPPLELKRHIESRFGGIARDLEAWMRLASAVLSSLSDNIAVVTYPRATLPRIKHIQIVHLQEFLALLIVVLAEARLRKQLIPLEDPYTQDDLTTIANKLNAAYSGHTFEDFPNKAVELTPFEEAVQQVTLSILREACNEGSADLSIDGIRLLLAQPEFSQMGKAQEVMESFEDRILVRSILSEAPRAGNLAIYIGEENTVERLKPYSVVLCQYGIPEEASGLVGVIGPTRMEYSQVIGSVKFLSSFMSNLVASTQSGS